jgi:RNA ligase
LVHNCLGILYRHNGKFCVSTRGSLTSKYGKWATEYLNNNFNLKELPLYTTLMFEIIYPGSRIVIDYHGREDLVLLAARDRSYGMDYNDKLIDKMALRWGFSRPKRYDITSVNDYLELAKTIDATMEGWVLRFSDGSRWKIKGDTYKYIAKILQGISRKHVIESLMNGTIDSWQSNIPEEYQDEVKLWRKEAEEFVTTKLERLIKIPRAYCFDSRKEFVLWAKEKYPNDFSFLMSIEDNHDIKKDLYKSLLKGL